MPDITTRLRQTRADMIGTADEQHYWDCHEAASHIELLEAAHKASGSALAVIDAGFQNAVAEIQRLRLTDEEREAIREACDEGRWYPKDYHHIDTLRGLLKRLSPDRPEAIAAGDTATPPEPAIPPAWLSRPYWVDPAGGHKYGFPRLYDPATDGDMTAWLIRQGYPESLAMQELACTFTACTDSGEK